MGAMQTALADNMTYMFKGCGKLTSLDLTPLNTANVTDMSMMFYGCGSLISLDLTPLNIDKVTDMGHMFEGCNNLQTLYCDRDWSQSAVLTKSWNMFAYCNKLVGGKGTKYTGSYLEKDYARPDGGPDSDTPGYFTLPPKFFTVTLNTEHGTITVTEDVDLNNVQEETVLHLTATPDEGYEFAGWTNYNPETGLVVTSDTTVTATFSWITVWYTVTYFDWDMSVLGTEQVEEGHDAKGLETDPEREGYTFIGWTQSLDNITSDIFVQAQYEKKETTALGDMEADPHTSEANTHTIEAAPRKLLRNGTLLIDRNGILYTLSGVRLD